MLLWLTSYTVTAGKCSCTGLIYRYHLWKVLLVNVHNQRNHLELKHNTMQILFQFKIYACFQQDVKDRLMTWSLNWAGSDLIHLSFSGRYIHWLPIYCSKNTVACLKCTRGKKLLCTNICFNTHLKSHHFPPICFKFGILAKISLSLSLSVMYVIHYG